MFQLQCSLCTRCSHQLSKLFCGSIFSVIFVLATGVGVEGAEAAPTSSEHVRWGETLEGFRVGARPVSARRILLRLQLMGVASPPPDEVRRNRALHRALYPLVEEELLRGALGQRRLEVDQAKLLAREAELIRRSGGPAQWTRRITQRRSTPAEERARLWREAAVAKLLEDLPVLEPDEETLRASYEALSRRYQRPASIRLRQVFLQVRPSSTPEERRARRNELSALRTMIQRPGMTMEQVARQHSEDETRHQGGLLTNLKAGELLPGLEAALQRLEIGELSEPVESALGFHLLRIEGRNPARNVSFEQAREQLIAHVRARELPRARRNLLRSLWENAEISGPIALPPPRALKRSPRRGARSSSRN